MRADAKIFVEQALLLFDKAGMSIDELANKSGLNRTTIYRLFHGQRDWVDRSTATKIARGLGAEIEFKRSQVRLFLANPSEKIERILEDSISINEKEAAVGLFIGRVVEMLRKLDVEALEIAEDLVKLIVTMDKEDLVNLHHVQKVLLEDENRMLFKEKLKAFVALVMPYHVREDGGFFR